MSIQKLEKLLQEQIDKEQHDVLQQFKNWNCHDNFQEQAILSMW
jgi:hypothetical protein